MKIIEFLINHWSDFLLVLAFIFSVFRILKTGEVGALKQAIYKFVTDAEKMYGGGTGELKKSQVIEWIYEKIPQNVQRLFTKKEIEGLIENVLDTAKFKWQSNKNLKNYIEKDGE